MQKNNDDFKIVKKGDKDKAEYLAVIKNAVKELETVQEKFVQSDLTSKEYIDSLTQTISSSIKALQSVAQERPQVVVQTEMFEAIINKSFSHFKDVLKKLEEYCDRVNTPEIINKISPPNINVEAAKVNVDLVGLEELLRKELPLVFEKLIGEISELKSLDNEKVEIKNWPKKPSEAIPVVLVDKELKKFYNAVASFIGGGGGNFVQGPVKYKDGDTEVIVTPDTPLPVDVISGEITIEGDVVVDQVGIEDVAGVKINPRKEDGHGSSRSDSSFTSETTKRDLIPYAEFLTADDSIEPPPGKCVELVWALVVANSDNSNANGVTIQMTLSAVLTNVYAVYALGRSAEFKGDVDTDLLINLENANPVSVNLQYRFVDP